MADLPEHVKEAMRNRARIVKEKMAGGGGFKRLSLTGKNAIVQPGREITLRLLPRWDVKQKYIRDPKDPKKAIVNPKYQNGPIFVEAWEHWYDTPDGKTVREWCPKTLDQDAACPLCEASEQLAASAEKSDRDLAKRIGSKEVFLFNAILGGDGKRAMNDQGKPDIQLLPAPGTIYVGITGIMLGGEDDSFARGDITHPSEGYNIKLSRPAQMGDRWKVDAAAKPSPLISDSERQAFSGWMDLLIDIPALLEKEVKSYEDLYQAFHGVAAPPAGGAPEGGEEGTGDLPDDLPPDDGPGDAVVGDEGDGTPVDPFLGDTPFDPPAAPAPARRQAPRPAAPARRAAPPARGGRR